MSSSQAFEGEESQVFLEVSRVPAHVGVLWPTAEAARNCERGDIRLAFGRQSGFIANVAFDETRIDYSLRYDNALHFSPFFQEYENALARRLVERYELRNKEVVEVGAGSGRFIGLLCELGDNRGTGYDPSHIPESADERVGDRVEIVRDYYSERYADRPADLICCRHVLEHIPQPRSFLRSLRGALTAHPRCVVYFEVPNSYIILHQLSIWDIIYEHCGYFVPESLGAMFEACGFEILELRETYQGQFVGVEARPGKLVTTRADSPDLDALSDTVSSFSRRFEAKRCEWQQRLAHLRRQGRRVVVWGAGAKAVSFSNLLEIGEQIEYAVDINPGKQGSYLAGNGQKIVPPEFLRTYQPDVAIVMNPIYKSEIDRELERLGLRTETVTL